ncbi:MAG: nucleoside hydrolase-like domain-containing protein [Bryobacteraceae bacterium]
MMRTCLLLPLLLAASLMAADKPRLIVLTDISNEPDDEQSLVRLLVYSNEFDLEGLIATTSVWLRDKIRPDIIRETIGAYAKVQPSLLKHAPGFPPAERLLGLVKSGSAEFGMRGVGFGKSTEGSNWIIEVVDRPDPRPVWVAVWGGANTLAQALWDVKYTRSAEELARFVARLRVYTISDQDDAGRWLRITFPDLFYIVSPSSVDGREYYLATWTGISGDRHYRNGPMEDFELVDNPWLEENIIRGHGPLGARYPKLAYIMEGDTPSFLNLIRNGLGGDVEPSYGGWGGRYELRRSYAETRPIWTNSRDTVRTRDGREHTSNPATIWRWRRAFQHDFAARMDWCVQPFDKANHNPVAVLNGDKTKNVLSVQAVAGRPVTFSAAGSSDPDGHALSFRWWIYPEAGTFRGKAALSKAEGPETVLSWEPGAKPGTVHVILEITDNGSPPLTSYRRAVVSIP